MSWTGFLFAYLLGGVTFIPLVIAAVLLHAHLTFPHRPDATGSAATATGTVEDKNDGKAKALIKDHRHNSADPDDGDQKQQLGLLSSASSSSSSSSSPSGSPIAGNALPSGSSPLRQSSEPDAAAGFFAVCRSYSPMGAGSRPIERATPVGSAAVLAAAAPSQSVYQSMYRSLFERKSSTPGLLDDKKGADISQRPKRSGNNVFFVVLRHGHLMLFDDDEQVEVRHVIPLASYDISFFSGGDKTSEGQLWIKRTAICLIRKDDGAGDKDKEDSKTPSFRPYYFFSENCSAKEDFYFALLRSRDRALGGASTKGGAPTPRALGFDLGDMLSLIRRLHSAEESSQTRWFNALVGRVFLAINKTADFEDLVRQKLNQKISRVKRPALVSDVTIKHIETGNSAPQFLNPRVREMSVEGECIVEADIRYSGGFRMEVSATVKIDLGSRFKVREVSVVLAVVIRRLDGHLYIKIKPPPSNRVWYAFSTMPRIEMTLEPIISSRQITYSVVLRQIESRIKEVISETVVVPYWDDFAFFRTEHKRWRGGIFAGDDAVAPKGPPASSGHSICSCGGSEVNAAEYTVTPPQPVVSQPDVSEPAASQPDATPPAVTQPAASPPAVGQGGSLEVNSHGLGQSQSLPNLEATAMLMTPPQKSSGSLFGIRKRGTDSSKDSQPGSSGLRFSNSNESTTSIEAAAPQSPALTPQLPSPAETPPALVLQASITCQPTPPSPMKSNPPQHQQPARLASRSPTLSAGSSQGDGGKRDDPDSEHEAGHSAGRSRLQRNEAFLLGSSDSSGEGGEQSAVRPKSIDDGMSPTPPPPPAASSEPVSRPSSIRTLSGGRSFFPRRDNSGSGSVASSSDRRSTANSNSEASDDGNNNPAPAKRGNSLANAARQWGWNALQRHKDPQPTTPRQPDQASGSSSGLSHPIGGGRPLPPPGVPLPGPDMPSTRIQPPPRLPKRFVPPMPTVAPPLPPRPIESDLELYHYMQTQQQPFSSRRRRMEGTHERGDSRDNILVVAAPRESPEPTTPPSLAGPFPAQPTAAGPSSEPPEEDLEATPRATGTRAIKTHPTTEPAGMYGDGDDEQSRP